MNKINEYIGENVTRKGMAARVDYLKKRLGSLNCMNKTQIYEVLEGFQKMKTRKMTDKEHDLFITALRKHG